MRDVKRLEKFYDEMREIHSLSFGDWRFGQLIYNFISEYGDPFFLEEDEFITELKKYANKNSPICHWVVDEKK